MGVEFHEGVYCRQLKYVSVAARSMDQWIFVREGAHAPWRLPGGMRNGDEEIYAAAARILRAETGAGDFRLEPVTAYCMDGADDYGGLYFADVDSRLEPGAGGAQVCLAEAWPAGSSAPEEGRALLSKVCQWLEGGGDEEALDGIFGMYL